jgi:MFS family permease
MSELDRDRAAATRWSTVALLVGAGMVSAFQIGKAPAALGHLRADLGFGLVTAGWVISMFNVIGVGLGTLLGAATSRIGDRRMVIGGLLLTAAASFAGALSQGAAILLATRFVEGLGFLATVIGVPALIIRLARSHDYKLAFGIWGTYMPAGTAFMMLLSPLFLAPFGWRGLWLANALVVALFAAMLATATRGLRDGAMSSTPGLAAIGRDMWETLRAGGPLLVALAFGSYTLNFIAVLGFLPTILVEREGLSQPLAATLTAIAIAANVPGNLVGGVLLHWGVPRWRLVAGASLVMALCAIGIYSDALPLAARYTLTVLFSAVGGMLPATVLGWAPATAPTPRLAPTANGLVVQGSHFGQMLGPPALAALAVATGDWSWSPGVLVASAAVGITCALALRRTERRRAAAPLPPKVVGPVEMR